MRWGSVEDALAGRSIGAVAGRAVVSAFVLVLAHDTLALAGFRSDANRLPVSAARKALGTPLPYATVRVDDERRATLVGGAREQLALRPAQVAAGGRVFVFAKIPPERGEEAFEAEFLIRRQDAWHRERVIEKPAGKIGFVSSTLVVENLEPGPVPTAIFRRTAVAGEMQSVVSTSVRVPSGARMKLGFSLDEWDWAGLAPVKVSVSAVVLDEDAGGDREVPIFEATLDPDSGSPRWFDHTVDLEAVANSEVHFAFRALPQHGPGRIAPHVVWAAPTVVLGRTLSSMPSVVLVLIDGVRSRTLGCCGGTREVTPFLDGLFAKTGAIFEHAVTPAVDTIPAHMTLFTGVPPCAHGVLTAKQTLSHDVETFAQIMASGGYATAVFTDGAGMAAELGFGRGISAFYQYSKLDKWSREGSAGFVFERAADWIALHADEPFVAVVHTRQAKPPYVPPRGYLDLFKQPKTNEEASVDVGERVRYERGVRYLDDTIHAFVTRLDAASLPERTLLVVTSAHGEEFLEHGARDHGTQLYDETVRVPLLMRGAKLKSGRRYAGVVGLIDVPPTVLELAGFPVPPSMRGTSLAKAVRSGKPAELPARVSEAHAPKRRTAEGLDASWRPPALAVSDARHKLIVEQDAAGVALVEAFDLVADPGETNNLMPSGAPPEWAAKLRQELVAYRTSCTKSAKKPQATETLPVTTLFKLKAFGYL